ncbi:hypothetical protein ACK8N7_26480 [Streptomyces griseobrunneus]
MDAGLAAVIAGAAGAGGAALAAFATSSGLIKQAKLQGTNAHQLWLRNHQQQAYEGLMVAIDRIVRSCRDAIATAESVRSHGFSEAERQQAVPVLQDIAVQARALQSSLHRTMLLAEGQASETAFALGEAGLTLAEVSTAIATELATPAITPSNSMEELQEAKDGVTRTQGEFLAWAGAQLQAG